MKLRLKNKIVLKIILSEKFIKKMLSIKFLLSQIYKINYHAKV